MGGFTFAQCLILIVVASTLAFCTANKEFRRPKYTHTPNKIIVGGSEGWRFNFTYIDWVRKNGPFYVNDTLGEFITCPPIIYIMRNIRCMYLYDDR
jgi:hypothetical protein